MGTKENPGKFNCYENALPDEPMFVMLARDPEFFELVCQWAEKRQKDIDCGERPITDQHMVFEAFDCARAGQIWRKQNYGKWRK